MSETVEVQRGWDYEGDEWWAPITSKRTPKYNRRLVPRELFRQYTLIAAEYQAVCAAMRDAEKPVPRRAPTPTDPTP